MNLKPIFTGKQKSRLKRCAIPGRCRTTSNRSFNELMEDQWEELVIKLDKSKNQYVFRTACCPGAPAC